MGNVPSDTPAHATGSQSDSSISVNFKRTRAVRLTNTSALVSFDGATSPATTLAPIRHPSKQASSDGPVEKGVLNVGQSGSRSDGIRYGLVLDKTRGPLKRKDSAKLTVYFCGIPPVEAQEKFKPSQKSKSPVVGDSATGDVSEVHLFDVVKMVNAFNAARGNLPMSMKDDKTGFTGFVEIHLNLVHPISIHQSTNHSSAGNSGNLTPGYSGGAKGAEKSVIYLNDMTTKMVIDCHTTAKSIIEGLMEKYRVVDNISNFGLFECEGRRGGPGGRRMDSKEEPLLLVLLWGPCPMHSLSLQLVSSGRKRMDTLIHWDRFTYTELGNFLKMLNIEEEKYVSIIKKNYEMKRLRIEKLIQSKQDSFDMEQEGASSSNESET
eukprot:scpid52581/ scgid13320/ Ras association domain-containing protein 1